MKKINLAISGCLGRMGQQLIKSSKNNKNFKLTALTENEVINKKIAGIELKQTVDYISSEILKCKLGASKFMENKNCPENSVKASQGAIANLKDKNPFNLKLDALHNANTYTLGMIGVNSSGTDVTVKTCFIKWCPPEGQISDIIKVYK